MSLSTPLVLSVALCMWACKADDTAGTAEGTGTGGSEGIATLDTTAEAGSADAGDGDGDGDGDPGDGDGDPGDGDGDSTSSGASLPCEGQIWACGDGIDNDGDGKIDLDDPECISPCDDDEGSFATNLPGQNVDCKGDCFWDQDSGGGNDGCNWNLICDPRNPGAGTMCEYNPNWMMCDLVQTQQCIETCAPITPNGCDCFGCCEIQGETYYLGNGDNCSLDNLAGCHTCTFHEGCNNDCQPELCELCFGQDPSELPEECDEPECPDGIQSCTSSADCEEGFFCQTGCCYPIALP